MRSRVGLFLSLLLISCGTTPTPPPAAGSLDIYFIDVEGGQATLIVSPEGESMLVDTGWPGFEGRDAQRIAETAKQAGMKQIDYLVTTHYHTDHVGGVPQLAEQIPIIHFVDHGPTQEGSERAKKLYENYQEVLKEGQHLAVEPGDHVPLKGADVLVLTAAGKVINSPIEGAGAENPLCTSAERREEDKSENAQSLGFLLTFGEFRFINLGDLTWNKELDLVCPDNRVGTVDVYLTTHHGLHSSGPAAIVHALRPRVAIMNNGSKKGGIPEAWQIVKSSPGLEDFWQLHYAVMGREENNSPERFLANLEDDHKGYWVKLSARRDGSFTVLNSRNHFEKTYPARE